MQKAYQMPNDTEKQKRNRKGTGTGVHLIGEKKGNNLALETSVQPSPESKSEGWAKKRALIKAVTDWKNYAENNEAKIITLEDGTEQPISDHILPLYELNKEAKTGNRLAIVAYYEITEAQKSEVRNTDKDGNDVKNQPIIVFSSSEKDLLKELNE